MSSYETSVTKGDDADGGRLKRPLTSGAIPSWSAESHSWILVPEDESPFDDSEHIDSPANGEQSAASEDETCPFGFSDSPLLTQSVLLETVEDIMREVASEDDRPDHTSAATHSTLAKRPLARQIYSPVSSPLTRPVSSSLSDTTISQFLATEISRSCCASPRSCCASPQSDMLCEEVPCDSSSTPDRVARGSSTRLPSSTAPFETHGQSSLHLTDMTTRATPNWHATACQWSRPMALMAMLLATHAAAFLLGMAVARTPPSLAQNYTLIRRFSSSGFNSRLCMA